MPNKLFVPKSIKSAKYSPCFQVCLESVIILLDKLNRFGSRHAAFVSRDNVRYLDMTNVSAVKNILHQLFKNFTWKKMFECLLLIPFPKQCKSLKTHSDPTSFYSRKIYVLNKEGINLLFETTTKFSRSISEGSKPVVPSGS